jgi:hypothetical protein
LTGLNKTPCITIPFQQKRLRRNLRASGEDKAVNTIKEPFLAPSYVLYFTASVRLPQGALARIGSLLEGSD